MANLDYSEFDDTDAKGIINTKDLPDKFQNAIGSFDPKFRFNSANVHVNMGFSANFT
jgi:hypothetical protein